MATTTKKGAKNSRAVPRRPVAKQSQSKGTQTIEALKRERDELLEQQTATSEILRMIASSSADLQSVFDAIAENAARLCDANDAVVRRIDGDTYQMVAHFGSITTAIRSGESVPIYRDTVDGRAIFDRKKVHVRSEEHTSELQS